MKSDKFFIIEILSRPPKKYITNKTDVIYLVGSWSLDLLDLNDYGLKNNKGYRYLLVVFGLFSRFGLTVRLYKKSAQIPKDSCGNILISSKRKQNLIESDDGKECVNEILTNFLNKTIIFIKSLFIKRCIFFKTFHLNYQRSSWKTVFGKTDANGLMKCLQ